MKESINFNRLKFNKDYFTPEVRKVILFGVIISVMIIIGFSNLFNIFIKSELEGIVIANAGDNTKVDVLLQNGERRYFSGTPDQYSPGDQIVMASSDPMDFITWKNIVPTMLAMLFSLILGVLIIVYIYQLLIYSKTDPLHTWQLFVDTMST